MQWHPKLLEPLPALEIENEFTPRCIWSDEATIWVSNHAGNIGVIGARVLAYNLSTRERDSVKDF